MEMIVGESDEDFLSRWSRRKADQKGSEPAPSAEPPAASPEGADLPEGTDSGEAPDEAAIVAELPDIESLDKESDFSAFMKQGVPDALRRQALRKLWKVNPVFGFLDGMNDYDEDFTITTSIAGGVKTLYQVGKGMVREEEEEEEKEDTGPADSEEPEAVEADQPDDPTPDEPDLVADESAEKPEAEEAKASEDRHGASEAASAFAGNDRSESGTEPASSAGLPSKDPVSGSAVQRRWGGFRT